MSSEVFPAKARQRCFKTTEENIYIICFHAGEDTRFHDYYLGKSRPEKTEMKYIRAYSFQ